MTEAGDPGIAPAAAPSLARNSAARFFADGMALVLGTAFALLTARWLGADGKGVVAAFSVWETLLFQLCSVGLPEAAIVRIGQGVVPQRALSASLAVLLPSSLLGGAALVAVVAGQVGVEASGGLDIGLLMVACLVCNLLAAFGACLLVAEERIAVCSAIAVVSQAVMVLCFAALGAASSATFGTAVVSILVGNALSLVLTVAVLRRMGLGLRPMWDRPYLVRALRYGIRAQPAVVLFSAAGRLDLPLVYGVAGATEAGRYSIALTYGTLASAAAVAAAFALFPRMARIDELSALELRGRAARSSLLVSSAVAVVLGLAAPLLIVLAFGEEFRAAIGPSVVLCVAAVPWSVQWVVARAESARDRPTVLLWSYLANAALTLGLDVVLLGRHGILAAALSSLAGNVLGAALALRMSALPLRALRPTVADARGLLAAARSIVGPLRRPGPA